MYNILEDRGKRKWPIFLNHFNSPDPKSQRELLWRSMSSVRHNSSRWLFGSGELKWFKMIDHFVFAPSSKMLCINYVLCWRYIIHVLSILCWHVFCFPKKTCFIYIKNTSLIQKHSSITLTWDCLCGKGMPFWRIKGVPFMRCISTHKWNLKPFIRQARYAASQRSKWRRVLRCVQ